MRTMLTVLFAGAAVSAATIVSSSEAVHGFTPFVVLSTGALLLAYWVVTSDHAPANTGTQVHKKAA